MIATIGARRSSFVSTLTWLGRSTPIILLGYRMILVSAVTTSTGVVVRDRR
jgi:hypothetical protein